MQNPNYRVDHVQSSATITHFLSEISLLYRQIADCYTEIAMMLSSNYGEKDRIRALNDEIWGCSIEIQSLRLKVSRMGIATSESGIARSSSQ